MLIQFLVVCVFEVLFADVPDTKAAEKGILFILADVIFRNPVRVDFSHNILQPPLWT